MAKSFRSTCIEIFSKVPKNTNDLKTWKLESEKLWKKSCHVWVNIDGNFPIGNKSGFEGIFPKMMAVAGNRIPYDVYRDFLDETSTYYEEHLELDVEASAKKYLDKRMHDYEVRDKDSYFAETDRDLKDYFNSLQKPDDFDPNLLNNNYYRAQFIIETMSHTKFIKPGEFVNLRNNVYEVALMVAKQHIKGQPLKGVSDDE